MAVTNGQRVKEIETRLTPLTKQIHETPGREDQYIAMADEIAAGRRRFAPIDDDAWDVMLPKEQEINLLAYYHTLRLELLGLKQRLRKEADGPDGPSRAATWLDSTWTRGAITVGSLVSATMAIASTLHAFGLFY